MVLASQFHPLLVSVSKFGLRRCIPSSCFRFLYLAGTSVISSFRSFLSRFTLSLVPTSTFFVFSSLEHDSRCVVTAFLRNGRLQRGHEIISTVSLIGMVPKTRRSCGSNCFAIGDPAFSEVVDPGGSPTQSYDLKRTAALTCLNLDFMCDILPFWRGCGRRDFRPDGL